MSNTVWFALSIIFQLSGAILLIISSFAGAKKNVISDYFSQITFVEKADKNMDRLLINDKGKIKDTLRGIYMNRISFIYLLVGYALTVIGENESTNKWILAVALLMISVVFSVINHYLIGLYAQWKSGSVEYLLFDSKDVPNGSIVDIMDEDK